MPERLTTETWIAKARELHGDRYDYSLVEYRNSKTKIKIICREHGVWNASPGLHISKKTGCPVCGGSKKKTTQQFVVQANEIHGTKYDYTNTKYKNAHTNVAITCDIHGVFHQTPDAHLRGQGCRECGKEGNLSNIRTEAIKSIQARLTEKTKGLVSLIEDSYSSMNSEADFVCNKHGQFRRLVNPVIFRAHACLECAKELPHFNLKDQDTAEAQIRELLRNSRYSVKPFPYKNKKTLITFSCPDHGEWTVQFASVTSNGINCPGCVHVGASEKRADGVRKANLKKRSEYWANYLVQFEEQHGNKFDYSLAKFVNGKTPIEIICPEHGKFMQTADAHSKSGCIACRDAELAGLYSARFFELKPELKDVPALLYLLELSWGKDHCFKFGITRTSLLRRFGAAKGKGIEVKVLATKETTLYTAWSLEQVCLSDEAIERYELSDKIFARSARISPSELVKDLPQYWKTMVDWTQTDPYVL